MKKSKLTKSDVKKSRALVEKAKKLVKKAQEDQARDAFIEALRSSEGKPEDDEVFLDKFKKDVLGPELQELIAICNVGHKRGNGRSKPSRMGRVDVVYEDDDIPLTQDERW